MVRIVCGVQVKDRKRSMNLMLILGFNVALDQLAMANCVHWYVHELRREDVHVVRRALYFEVDDQRKKWSPKRT